MTTTYPYRYNTTRKTLAEIEAILSPHYHPEYLRRFLAWMKSRGGEIGVGGHWRSDGSQPDKPGFAPEGKSFHQNQQYSDGFIGACAIDMVATNPNGGVHLAPRWDQVPAQGSTEAALWGIHCNVGTPGAYGSESWHIQPIEIDGWATATGNGSHPAPAPVAGYPLPTDQPTAPPEVIPPIIDPPEVIDMSTAIRWRHPKYLDQFVIDGARVKRPTAAQFAAQKLADLELVIEDNDTELFNLCEAAGVDPASLKSA